AALGGGTTPTETIPSIAIEVPGNATELHACFLANDPPIVGRVQNDVFSIDLRTLLESDLTNEASALR
ncbi:MAG: L-seryl-tRNA(Sec) selenium transferase, partial [Thermoanaerobaculia bacterium]